MIDKKKAVPPQNSQKVNYLIKANYNKKTSIVKQYKAHANEYRDAIIGVFDCKQDALNSASQYNYGMNFHVAGNCFDSADYALRVFTAEEAVGYQGQDGYFSLECRSAGNVFLRIPVWQSIDSLPTVYKCCSELSEGGSEKLIYRSFKCRHCSLSTEHLAGQLAYQQVKLRKIGFTEPALLMVIEAVQGMGIQFDTLAALKHAVSLSDGFYYSFCNTSEVLYE